jgi:uncharacterized protein YbjQ (UPF0145 family)
VADRWKRSVRSAAERDSGDLEAGMVGARWQEHLQIVHGWDALRRRALGRLIKQAKLLGCQAVVGIEPRRDFESAGEGGYGDVVLQFTGTAVRVDGWHRRTSLPVLTLASVVEVASMLTRGVEPVGIVAGVGRIELRPGDTTIRASRRSGFAKPSLELEDVTHSVYEVRRAAMEGMRAEAGKLNATGVVGVRLELEREGASTQRFASVVFTAHALGSAVRRTATPAAPACSVSPVVGLAKRSDG